MYGEKGAKIGERLWEETMEEFRRADITLPAL